MRFEWVRTEGAESCASSEALRAEVTRRLGRDPFRHDAPRAIEGVVSRRGGRWRARIFIRGAEGEPTGVRELSSAAPTCLSLDSAAALAISLAIDPEASLGPTPPVVPPPPPQEPEPPAELAGQTPLPPPTPRRRLWGELGAHGLLVLGALPQPAVGVSVNGGLAVGMFRLRLGVTYLPEVAAEGGDFSFGLTTIDLSLCPGLPVGRRGEVRLCGTVRAGAIHAVVHRYSPTDPGQRAWGAAGARLEGFLALGRHGFTQLGFELSAPLVRHRFRVEGRENPIFRQSPVVGWLSLGAGVHFR